jgi:hypothetical protein
MGWKIVNQEKDAFFCAVDGNPNDIINISEKDIILEGLREYWRWIRYKEIRQAKQDNSELLPLSRSPLPNTVAHLIGDYLRNDDIAAALTLLQSAAYYEKMPSAVIIGTLVRQGYFASGDARIFTYLVNNVRSGRWDALLPSILECNLMLDPLNVLNSASDQHSFWMMPWSLLDLDELHGAGGRDAVVYFIHSIVERLEVIDHLTVSIGSIVSDRRMRKKQLIGGLIDLYQLLRATGSQAMAPLIPAILGCIVSSLIQHDEIYRSLLEELYERIRILDEGDEVDDVLHFLASIDAPIVRLDLSLMLLERKFHLLSRGVFRENRHVARLTGILQVLSISKIESYRSGAREGIHCRWVYRLLRQAIYCLRLMLAEICDTDPYLFDITQLLGKIRTEINAGRKEGPITMLIDDCLRVISMPISQSVPSNNTS